MCTLLSGSPRLPYLSEEAKALLIMENRCLIGRSGALPQRGVGGVGVVAARTVGASWCAGAAATARSARGPLRRPHPRPLKVLVHAAARSGDNSDGAHGAGSNSSNNNASPRGAGGAAAPRFEARLLWRRFPAIAAVAACAALAAANGARAWAAPATAPPSAAVVVAPCTREAVQQQQQQQQRPNLGRTSKRAVAAAVEARILRSGQAAAAAAAQPVPSAPLPAVASATLAAPGPAAAAGDCLERARYLALRLLAAPTAGKLLAVLAVALPVVLAGGAAYHIALGSPWPEALARAYHVMANSPGVDVTSEPSRAAAAVTGAIYLAGARS